MCRCPTGAPSRGSTPMARCSGGATTARPRISRCGWRMPMTGGRTCRATARLFGVSVASVVKWSQRFRATGSAAAYWMGGHRPRVLAGERDWLLARLAEKPDLTLRALVAELVERGVPASYGALWRQIGRAHV